MGNPRQSYGASLAIRDHTILPATRHKWTCPTITPARYSIYLPRRNGRLSWPRLPGNASAGSQTCDHKSDALTTTPPSRLNSSSCLHYTWLLWLCQSAVATNSDKTLRQCLPSAGFSVETVVHLDSLRTCSHHERSTTNNRKWMMHRQLPGPSLDMHSSSCIATPCTSVTGESDDGAYHCKKGAHSSLWEPISVLWAPLAKRDHTVLPATCPTASEQMSFESLPGLNVTIIL